MCADRSEPSEAPSQKAAGSGAAEPDGFSPTIPPGGEPKRFRADDTVDEPFVTEKDCDCVTALQKMV